MTGSFKYVVPENLLRRTRSVNSSIASRMMEEEIGNGFDYKKTKKLRKQIAEDLIAQEHRLVKPGVISVLNALRAASVPMGIATSTPAQETQVHLAHFGLDTYFDAKVTGDMVANGKPAPDIYLKAAERLNQPPECCIAVEDSPAGIESARQAGMYAVLIPDQAIITDQVRKRASATVTDFNELFTLLSDVLSKPLELPCETHSDV